MFFCSRESIAKEGRLELMIQHTSKALCRTSNSSSKAPNHFLEETLWFPITMKTSQLEPVLLRYLYVAENGVAVLTNTTLPLETAAALQNPSLMLKFFFLKEFKVVLAPLWMRSGLSKTNNQSKVCVESFDSFKSTNFNMLSINKLIKTRLSEDFNALSVTVASWINLVPKWKNESQYEANTASGEGISFQIVIATDYNSTYLITSYGEMKLSSRYSLAEYIHAMGPAVFNGTIQKLEGEEDGSPL